MSRFMLAGDGGRDGDEQRFVELHKDIIELYDANDMKRQVTQVYSWFRSLPPLFQACVLMGVMLFWIVCAPFVILALINIAKHHYSQDRLMTSVMIACLSFAGLVIVVYIIPQRV